MGKNQLSIFVIQQSPDIGGAEIFMLDLIHEMSRNGDNINLVTNKGKFFDLAKKKKIKTKNLPFVLDIIGNYKGIIKTLLVLPLATVYYFNLVKKIRGSRADVVLMSGFSEKMLVTFLSIFFRIPVVWIEYSRLTEIFKRNFFMPKILYTLLSQIAKKIIVPTKYARDGLSQDVNLSKNKIIVLPLGIKLPKVQTKKIHGDFVIGNVSRLTYEKGQHFLIEAMPEIIKNIPNAKLILVGDGPDKQNFEKQVKRLKLEKRVKITGFVDNVDKYYEKMDVFVFPTIWKLEGFGLVVVEAMSRKIPVIASNINHMKEIITDGKNGLLVIPYDKIDLSEKVIKLYKDKSLREAIVKNAYKDSIEKYDIKNVAKKILKTIRDSLDK